jgi:hypothetical protein
MPPQAYTKEVLATAFDWLSRQNESVKKSIRTSDDLVGLYLKSTRMKENQEGQAQTGGYSADLSSAKSFRSELQGLALNLKQFEDKPAQEPQKSEPTSEYLHELSLMMSTQNQAPQKPQQYEVPQPNTHQRFTPQNTTPNPANDETQHMPSSKESIPLPPSADSAETVLLKLDKKTISAINLAKERLNLSSNTEAIRVLVSLGEKHLKKVFGPEE